MPFFLKELFVKLRFWWANWTKHHVWPSDPFLLCGVDNWETIWSAKATGNIIRMIYIRYVVKVCYQHCKPFPWLSAKEKQLCQIELLFPLYLNSMEEKTLVFKETNQSSFRQSLIFIRYFRPYTETVAITEIHSYLIVSIQPIFRYIIPTNPTMHQAHIPIIPQCITL